MERRPHTARRNPVWPDAAALAALLAAWAGIAGCEREAAPDSARSAPGDDSLWERHPLRGAPAGPRANIALVMWGDQDAPSERPRRGQGLVSIRAAPSRIPRAAGAPSPDQEAFAPRRPPATRGAAKLPPHLQRALEISPGGLHDIQIRLSPPGGTVSLPSWLDDAIAGGRITGAASLAEARRAWLAHRHARAAEILDPPAAALTARGGRVIERYPMLIGLRIAASRDMLLELLRSFPVTLVDRTARFVADGRPTPRPIAVSGRAAAEGHQLAQLSGPGLEPGGAPRLHMAMWEHDGVPYPDPAAWRRGGRPGLELLLPPCAHGDCRGAGSRHSPHASATLAVLRADVGDLVSSGLTVRADAIGQTALARVIDDTIASVDDVRVVSMSASLDSSHDWSCRGVDLVSRDVDALFEHGILVIKSAGNGGASERGCTIGPPGAATSVLTVAALAAGRDDADDVRRAAMLAASAVGGASGRGAADRSDPGRRAVIGLAAQGCRRESIADTGRDFVGCGTSFSTPTVGAAALLQLAFWEADRRTAFFHHRPGALTALLLAMGDGFAPETRRGDGDARGDVGFDRRAGAGRLRLRRLDRVGLDAPWGYQIAETCVSGAHVQYFPHEDGIVLPSGVEVMKAALSWYDPGIHDDGRINDLDLSIERAHGPAPGHPRQWRPIASSTHPLDNRERATVRGVGGQRLRVAVIGTHVRSRPAEPVCGGAQRAHLAYFYEDSRRDDPDGPTSIAAAPE